MIIKCQESGVHTRPGVAASEKTLLRPSREMADGTDTLSRVEEFHERTNTFYQFRALVSDG